VHRECHHRGQPGRLDGLKPQHGLAGPAERLGDDEVHARLSRPADLLVERGPHRPLGGLPWLVHVRVADIAGQQCARLACHLAGDGQGLAVQRFEHVFLANDPELLAVAVVRERLDDVRPGVDELPVQLFDDLGMFKHHLRNESARLQVPAAFAFEKITFGAHDWATRQHAEQIGHSILQGRLGNGPSVRESCNGRHRR
jgi:hypothetical protein